MSDEQDKLKLSLEPPKLFGRKKKAAPAAGASEPESTAPAPKKKPAPEPASEDAAAPVEEPVAAAAEPELVEEPDPVEAEPVVEEPVAEEPVIEEPVAEEPVADEPVAEPDDEPTEVIAVEKSAPETSVPEEHAAWAPSTGADEGATAVIDPVTAPEPDLTADPDPEPTAPLPSSDRTTKTRTPRIPGLTRTSRTPADGAPIDPALVDPDVEDAEIAAMAAQGPLLSAYRSAALTGLVVGAAMVVLTWLSLRGCEAVRGTSSCGGGPGFLLLIATFAVCVLLGSALLRAFEIPDPGSSSFLAVGLVAVVALLFLIDLLDHWSMLVLIPLLSIGAYLASVWVTKTFVEPVET